MSYREHPLFLMFMQLAVTSIFKSYPTVGDTALYLAFLPVWSYLHRCKFVKTDVLFLIILQKWLHTLLSYQSVRVSLSYVLCPIFILYDLSTWSIGLKGLFPSSSFCGHFTRWYMKEIQMIWIVCQVIFINVVYTCIVHTFILIYKSALYKIMFFSSQLHRKLI